MNLFSDVMGREKIEAMQNCIASLDNFNSTDAIFSDYGKSGIALDENRFLVCLLGADRRGNIYHKVVPVNYVISAEVIPVTKSHSEVRSNQIKGAVVGGILFGPLGMVIGSENAKSKHGSMITHYFLRLKLNNIQNPYHEVVIFPSNQWATELNRIERKLRKWQAKIEILKERARNVNQLKGEVIHSSPVVPYPHYSGVEQNRCSTSDLPVLPKMVDVIQPHCKLHSATFPRSIPIAIEKAEFAIGRAGSNDLILQEAAVSRQHALLRFADGRWMIQDRNSTGGLFVNDQRVKQQWLKDGDRIRVGSSAFVFSTK